MVCSGVVRQGRIELESGVQLPEGSVVRVEVVADEAAVLANDDRPAQAQSGTAQSREAWLENWRKFAKEVTESWKSPKTALETLSEMRR